MVEAVVSEEVDSAAAEELDTEAALVDAAVVVWVEVATVAAAAEAVSNRTLRQCSRTLSPMARLVEVNRMRLYTFATYDCAVML